MKCVKKYKKGVKLKMGVHKSRAGGLTAAGRAKLNRETGSNLKPPQPGGGKRRTSYCKRSLGQMKKWNINCSETPNKRICKARRNWKC